MAESQTTHAGKYKAMRRQVMCEENIVFKLIDTVLENNTF